MVAQMNFSEQKQRIYIKSPELTDTQTRLTEFCQLPEGGAEILLLHGAHGSGKSALLAEWLACYKKGMKHNDDQAVHAHHVGASVKSSDITNFMTAVVNEIRSVHVANGKVLFHWIISRICG